MPQAGVQLLLKIQAHIQERFGPTIDVSGIALPILKTRRSLLWFYKRLLLRVRPKAVFVASINYYERIAIEVCKSLGIPVIELQHGVIGPVDLCYVFPGTPACAAFRTTCSSTAHTGKAAWIFRCRTTASLPSAIRISKRGVREHRGIAKINQVVVISQPTVGPALSRFAVQLRQQPGFTASIVYRLHPYEGDWRQRYPWLANSGVTVSASDDGDIYSLLARSRMQIGVYSAALVEGLSFGLATYLVNLPGVEYLQALVDDGWAASFPVPPTSHPIRSRRSGSPPICFASPTAWCVFTQS